jgi:aromatase
VSTITIDIAAPPGLVFRLARDVTRWEVLLPHYVRSRLVREVADGASLVDFVARRSLVDVLGLGLPVAWRARTWSESERLRLRFVHVAGPTKGMDVTWRIDPTASGASVSIDHHFRPWLPSYGAFIEHGFTQPIARRTLATFKALAEALAVDAQSDGRRKTKHSL